jgi:hypothetical protein
MGTACGGNPSRPGGKRTPAARHARTKEWGDGAATWAQHAAASRHAPAARSFPPHAMPMGGRGDGVGHGDQFCAGRERPAYKQASLRDEFAGAARGGDHRAQSQKRPALVIFAPSWSGCPQRLSWRVLKTLPSSSFPRPPTHPLTPPISPFHCPMLQ